MLIRSDPEGASMLEDYLDHVCAPLVGVVPHARRQELRMEMQLHLEALSEELAEDGRTSRDALSAALREFGEPWAIGEGILREAPLAPATASPARPDASLHGVAWFSLPAAASLLLLTHWVVEAGTEEPPAALVLLGLFTPLLAGGLTGWTAPARAGAEVIRACCLVGAFALGVGLLLLPSLAGFWSLACVALYWAPAGLVAARAVVSARRHSRRAGFLRARLPGKVVS